MFKRLFNVQVLLWLALLLALVGSLRHVAWGFSTLEGGDIVAGYVQAVAVDVGLFSLAVGISQRKRQGRGTFVLWVGVILFAALSTYANMLHGLVFRADIGLDDWGWLDIARPFALSGVLPLLVVYLSEIVGSDVSYQLDLNAKERKRQERLERQMVSKPEDLSAFPYPIGQAQNMATEQARRSKAQALDAMLTLYQDNPNATMTQIGTAIGRSRSTVSNYLTELEQAGRINRNGDGIEVLAIEQ